MLAFVFPGQGSQQPGMGAAFAGDPSWSLVEEASDAVGRDVAGVRLRDGRRVTVLDHWPEGSDEARFLRRIRDDACRLFGTVLSPDYNAAHHNHLHLEVQEADWTMCR